MANDKLVIQQNSGGDQAPYIGPFHVSPIEYGYPGDTNTSYWARLDDTALAQDICVSTYQPWWVATPGFFQGFLIPTNQIRYHACGEELSVNFRVEMADAYSKYKYIATTDPDDGFKTPTQWCVDPTGIFWIVGFVNTKIVFTAVEKDGTYDVTEVDIGVNLESMFIMVRPINGGIFVCNRDITTTPIWYTATYSGGTIAATSRTTPSESQFTGSMEQPRPDGFYVLQKSSNGATQVYSYYDYNVKTGAVVKGEDITLPSWFDVPDQDWTIGLTFNAMVSNGRAYFVATKFDFQQPITSLAVFHYDVGTHSWTEAPSWLASAVSRFGITNPGHLWATRSGHRFVGISEGTVVSDPAFSYEVYNAAGTQLLNIDSVFHSADWPGSNWRPQFSYKEALPDGSYINATRAGVSNEDFQLQQTLDDRFLWSKSVGSNYEIRKFSVDSILSTPTIDGIGIANPNFYARGQFPLLDYSSWT